VGERPKVTVVVYVIEALVMEKVIIRISRVQTDTKVVGGLVEDRTCRIPSRGSCSLPPVLLVHRLVFCYKAH
jgi:hypothetical protein